MTDLAKANDHNATLRRAIEAVLVELRRVNEFADWGREIETLEAALRATES